MLCSKGGTEIRLSPLARLMFGLRKERGCASRVCARAAEEGMGWELWELDPVLCWLEADDMERFRFQQSGWSFFCSSARI